MWEALDAGVERVAPALKGTKQLAQMAWFYHSLDPAAVAGRGWLMHNAVLLQPTGLQRVEADPGDQRRESGLRACRSARRRSLRA